MARQTNAGFPVARMKHSRLLAPRSSFVLTCGRTASVGEAAAVYMQEARVRSNSRVRGAGIAQGTAVAGAGRV
jgi:hypothetical protein